MSNEPPPRERPFGWRDWLALGKSIALIPLSLVAAFALYAAGVFAWLIVKPLYHLLIHPLLPQIASVMALGAGVWLVVKLNTKLPLGKARKGSIRAIFWDLARTYTMGAVILATVVGIIWLCFLWRPA